MSDLQHDTADGVAAALARLHLERRLAHVHYYETSHAYADGACTYKVATRDVAHLERHGWRLAHRSRGFGSYCYVLPPQVVAARTFLRRNIPIEIVVPTEASLRRLALALHQAGRPWRGAAGTWPAKYEPRRVEPGCWQECFVTDGRGGHEERRWRPPYPWPAVFSAGEGRVWSRVVRWPDGDAAAPDWGDA
jgi:hypothetical protein